MFRRIKRDERKGMPFVSEEQNHPLRNLLILRSFLGLGSSKRVSYAPYSLAALMVFNRANVLGSFISACGSPAGRGPSRALEA